MGMAEFMDRKAEEREARDADESRCANPRCRKLLVPERLWLGYCSDECAWGHKELTDDKEESG